MQPAMMPGLGDLLQERLFVGVAEIDVAQLAVCTPYHRARHGHDAVLLDKIWLIGHVAPEYGNVVPLGLEPLQGRLL